MEAKISSETMEAKRKQYNILQVLKGNNYQLRILYPAKKYSSGEKREITTVSDGGK